MSLVVERGFDYGACMWNLALNDHDLESLRRSLAMLQVGQMALTREQGMELVAALIEARAEARRLQLG